MIGCKVTPNYNNLGETKALYCARHKLDGMVDVKHSICIHQNCETLSVYNNVGEKKGLYCKEHKLDGMENVLKQRCFHNDCNKSPCYNNIDEKKGLYCKEHKLDGMVNVKHMNCIYQNCKVTPTYNNYGETKALYCATHKLDGMVNVRDKPCIHVDCKKQRNYNNIGETKALYCATHKLDGMVDVKSKKCKNDWCLTTVRLEKYDGYCLFCYMNMFPDKQVSHNYKTKEYAVVEFVKNKFSYLTWITDKTIYGGCSKRRPDLLLDLGYQILIIEIDENQHINYDCSCENKRIMELSKDLYHRPIIFIRFNPDNYFKNNINISSCWTINKKGICVIKKTKIYEWSERLEILKNQICYWINPINKTNKIIEIIQLFYDI
jgi:hypothetical protein